MELGNRIDDICKDRVSFMNSLEVLSGQIKEYEHFMNEASSQHEKELLDMRKDIAKKFESNTAELQDLSVDRRQLRAMVRNQNSHWVEMQKEIAKLQKRSSETEKTCEEVQRLVNWTEETDNYLQNYLPSEMYSEMHRAMQATLASAPLKMRLDQIEFSHLRMQEAMEKISRVGTFN